MSHCNFTTTLHHLLKQRNLSLDQFARVMNFEHHYLHNLTLGTGDHKINDLRKMAHFFSISINQLIGDEPL